MEAPVVPEVMAEMLPVALVVEMEDSSKLS
jgi:hypothetical protein